MGLNTYQFGIYIGSTVHEVAQLVTVDNQISLQTTEDAAIVKMIRVILLVPFLLLLSAWQAKQTEAASNTAAGGSRDTQNRARIMIPWFALLFVMASIIASLHILSAEILACLKFKAILFLAMAMAALGLRTHYSSIRKAGIKPLGLAFILSLFLIIDSGLINIAILKL